MSAFGGLLLTNRGKNLHAKAQTGVLLKFTRIVLGSGDLGGSIIADLTDLKNQVASLALTKLKTMPGGKAVVGAIFSNQALAQGFSWKEVGIFAQDPDLGEILYCYGNAGSNADYIPAGGGADILEKSIDLTILTGNATNVEAVIDNSLVYATVQELNAIPRILVSDVAPADARTNDFWLELL